MATLRLLPAFEFPVAPENMARLVAGFKFGLVSLLVFALALFVGFEAMIDSAGTAGMCTAILAQPNAGAVFAKSYARLFGTISGGLACVALFWIFPQAPWLFAAGMALWMGVCAYWGGKFKYFASYAATLSGWTAAIVAMDTNNPEVAMVTAGNRVSAIIIGILAVAFVFGIIHIRRGFKTYLPPLLEMNDRIIAQAQEAVNHPETYDHVATMRKWAADIEAMHQSLEYAGAEDPEVALHARSIRCGLNELFADIADFNIRLKELGLLLKDSPERAFTDKINQGLLDAFNARLQETDAQADERMIVLRQQVLDYFAAQTEPNLLDRTRLLAEIHAARKLIDTMNRIRRGRQTFDEEDIRPLGQATTMRQNLYNGFVVAIAFMVSWGIFIVDQWQPSGMLFMMMVPTLLLVVVVTEDPATIIKMAFMGSIGCVLPALICSQVLMPLGSGFPWLILSFAVLIIPCSILKSFPSTAGMGTMFMMFGMMLSLPTNQMQYNLQLFLNNTQAMVAASIVGIATVLIFYPIRNRGKARRVERQATYELRRLKRHLRADRFAEWEDRQQERVGLIDRIGSLKGTVIARESIQALLIMMRIARCYRRQFNDLARVPVSASIKRLQGQAEWFWSRQFESTTHFRMVALRLVDALLAEAQAQPANALELLAAAQEWRMIATNNETLATLPC
ncbi:MAG: hypothetical protein RL651_1188 [Pseudomonadota bacterium]|jgi:uncharacterized membrane protein YccC